MASASGNSPLVRLARLAEVLIIGLLEMVLLGGLLVILLVKVLLVVLRSVAEVVEERGLGALLVVLEGLVVMPQVVVGEALQMVLAERAVMASLLLPCISDSV